MATRRQVFDPGLRQTRQERTMTTRVSEEGIDYDKPTVRVCRGEVYMVNPHDVAELLVYEARRARSPAHSNPDPGTCGFVLAQKRGERGEIVLGQLPRHRSRRSGIGSRRRLGLGRAARRDRACGGLDDLRGGGVGDSAPVMLYQDLMAKRRRPPSLIRRDSPKTAAPVKTAKSSSRPSKKAEAAGRASSGS